MPTEIPVDISLIDEAKSGAEKPADVAPDGDFVALHNRLAPMIWALAFDMAREKPGPERLNAILNSLLTATLAWVVALTPESVEGDSEHYNAIREKFVQNLDGMLQDSDAIRAQVSQLGNYQGRQMIMSHQNEAMTKSFIQLSNLIIASVGATPQDPSTAAKLAQFKAKGNGKDS